MKLHLYSISLKSKETFVRQIKNTEKGSVQVGRLKFSEAPPGAVNAQFRVRERGTRSQNMPSHARYALAHVPWGRNSFILRVLCPATSIQSCQFQVIKVKTV